MSLTKKSTKSLILLGAIIFLSIVVAYNLPVQNQFIGLDGYDYVGKKEVRPSGISDVHLRQILKHTGKIATIAVNPIGSVGGVYPPVEGQQPLFFTKNKNYIDLFVEPASAFSRWVYVITITYEDGHKEITPIIPE